MALIHARSTDKLKQDGAAYAVDEIKSTGGAAHVTDGNIGIARNRFCNAVHATLPTAAGTGTVTFTSPGTIDAVIDSLYLVAGPVPLTTTNWRIRYAIDSVSDAAAAILLPVTEPSHSATNDTGQVRSFNVTPIILPNTLDAGRIIFLILPTPINIGISGTLTRLDFIHNLGTGVTVQLGITALEKI